MSPMIPLAISATMLVVYLANQSADEEQREVTISSARIQDEQMQQYLDALLRYVKFNPSTPTSIQNTALDLPDTYQYPETKFFNIVVHTPPARVYAYMTGFTTNNGFHTDNQRSNRSTIGIMEQSGAIIGLLDPHIVIENHPPTGGKAIPKNSLVYFKDF